MRWFLAQVSGFFVCKLIESKQEKESKKKVLDNQIDNDFFAKLVMCMKNKTTKKESLFSLDLTKLESSTLLTFLAETETLFSKNSVQINVLRKIDTNFYQDILTSYTSPLTQVKKKYNKSNTETRDNLNSLFQKHIQQNLTNQKTQNLGTQTLTSPLNAYTVFSFVNIHSQSYIKIKKKAKHKMKDIQDIHIKMTNMQTMQTSFANISVYSKCSQAVDLDMSITFNALGQLEQLKYLDYIEKKSLDSFQNESKYDSSEIDKDDSKNQIEVNWSNNNTSKNEWFFQGKDSIF